MRTIDKAEVTIMSVTTKDSVTIVGEDNKGNFVVKQNNETIATCYTLESALDIAATLLNRTESNA